VLFGRDIFSDASVFIRSTDLWLPFVTAFESPFWGHSNMSNYTSSMIDAIDRGIGGTTNSLGSYFYRYGIIWGVGMVFLIAQSLRGYSKLDAASLPVVLLTMVYEPIGYSLIFLVIIFVGLNDRKRPQRYLIEFLSQDSHGVRVREWV
jgi:hypothetical protein